MAEALFIHSSLNKIDAFVFDLKDKNLAISCKVFLWRVEGGARTHDIQNHNLTL